MQRIPGRCETLLCWLERNVGFKFRKQNKNVIPPYVVQRNITFSLDVFSVQFQCCWSANKEQIPPSCVYSGMENLRAPWGTSSLGVLQSEMQSGHNFAIQAIVIRLNDKHRIIESTKHFSFL